MSLAFWIAIAVMFIAILPVILRGKGGDGTGSADGGSSTGNGNLSATVYELAQNADPIACNANPASCWTPVLSFPLNYAKGYSVLNFVDTNQWNGWITQWPTP